MKHTFRVVLVLVVTGMTCLVVGQVCSPPGQLCARTTDCCRGCCEQYTCMERAFSCSSDLAAVQNSPSCRNYFCPPNQICYLREVCPPESPCPRKPFCRSVYTSNTSTIISNYTRNGSRRRAGAITVIFVATIINVMGAQLWSLT